jgi:hypothetical protein
MITKRDFPLLFLGAAAGFAVGYAICWWNRPMPQLVNDSGQAVTKNPAKTLLDTSDSIQRMRPVLAPLAKGEIPSPRVIYDIVTGF